MVERRVRPNEWNSCMPLGRHGHCSLSEAVWAICGSHSKYTSRGQVRSFFMLPIMSSLGAVFHWEASTLRVRSRDSCWMLVILHSWWESIAITVIGWRPSLIWSLSWAQLTQVKVQEGFRSFAMYKLLVDLSQLAFYFGLAPVSMTIAAFVVRKGTCWDICWGFCMFQRENIPSPYQFVS